MAGIAALVGSAVAGAVPAAVAAASRKSGGRQKRRARARRTVSGPLARGQQRSDLKATMMPSSRRSRRRRGPRAGGTTVTDGQIQLAGSGTFKRVEAQNGYSGLLMGSSDFGIYGRADPMADYDNRTSLKVRGCGLFQVSIQADGKTAAAFNGVYWESLRPGVVDPRLQNFEKMFEGYAHRKLRFQYINNVGSPTVGAASVAFGVVDYDTSIDVTAPSQTQLLESPSSVLTPVWQPAEFTFSHKGGRVYSASLGEPDLSLEHQAYLGAVFNGNTTGGSTLAIGQIRVEYETDFYMPRMVDSSVPQRSIYFDEKGVGQFAPKTDPAASAASGSISTLVPPPLIRSEPTEDYVTVKTNPPSERSRSQPGNRLQPRAS